MTHRVEERVERGCRAQEDAQKCSTNAGGEDDSASRDLVANRDASEAAMVGGQQREAVQGGEGTYKLSEKKPPSRAIVKAVRDAVRIIPTGVC